MYMCIYIYIYIYIHIYIYIYRHKHIIIQYERTPTHTHADTNSLSHTNRYIYIHIYIYIYTYKCTRLGTIPIGHYVPWKLGRLDCWDLFAPARKHCKTFLLTSRCAIISRRATVPDSRQDNLFNSSINSSIHELKIENSDLWFVNNDLHWHTTSTGQKSTSLFTLLHYFMNELLHSLFTNLGPEYFCLPHWFFGFLATFWNLAPNIGKLGGYRRTPFKTAWGPQTILR